MEWNEIILLLRWLLPSPTGLNTIWSCLDRIIMRGRYHEKEIYYTYTYINGFLAHFTNSNLNLTDSYSRRIRKFSGQILVKITLFSMLIKFGGDAKFLFSEKWKKVCIICGVCYGAKVEERLSLEEKARIFAEEIIYGEIIIKIHYEITYVSIILNSHCKIRIWE